MSRGCSGSLSECRLEIPASSQSTVLLLTDSMHTSLGDLHSTLVTVTALCGMQAVTHQPDSKVCTKAKKLAFCENSL